MSAAFSIITPPVILFGRGVAAQAVPRIAGFGARVLVVHGRDATRAGWLIDGLTHAGAVTMAVACPREPTLPMLDAALLQLRPGAPDVVVGLGGGAVLDFAKALSALLPTDAAPLDHLEVVGRGLPLTSEPLPFVAIPTTAGTGAEVTKNAVIDVPEHRRKVSLRDDRMMARLAVVDPALTDGLPRAVTLASGLDAVVQVIEPWLSSRSNPYADALARAAIPAGLSALRRLMRGEDAAARDSMAWVSLCGGLCLANAGLGAVHGFAGVIGSLTGAPHGAICGTLLPHVLRMNARIMGPSPRMDDVLAWIAGEFGTLDGFEGWMHDAGLPRLSALGVVAADHQAIAMAARDASSMKANPVPPEVADLVAALAAAG